MKKIGLLITIIAFISTINASEWVNIKSNTPNSPKITLLNSNITTSVIQLNLDGFSLSDVNINGLTTNSITINKCTPLLKAGAPEVQKITTSLIIPDDANMSVNIISSKYNEYKDIVLTPSKGNLYRDINPDDIDYEFGNEYNTDSFYPGKIAELRNPHIMRNHRGQTVVIYPIQYNPVTKILRVYYDIVLEVSDNGEVGVNTLSRKQSVNRVNTSFKSVYSKHFLNYNSVASRYTPIEEQGNMLIISYGDFMDEMQPYVDWKIKAGMPVEIVDVATIGGTSQIKDYIADYYANKGVTFVLLVGDDAQVPTSSNGGNDSDIDYVYLDGNDHYPDALIGRFSAETEEHVVTQVNRTLEYEQNPITDPDWYSEAIGIASDQGTGDDNEYDYEHIRNINTDLLGFTYTYAYEFFDGSQGGEDAAGNPSPTDVALAVNSGATIINYTGHGSNTSWASSNFSNSDVNNLTNVGKWPFIFSVACVNGNFVGITCFAEAWLRAEDNGSPTGAIATFMSTINQSWDPPMCGQDEMNDILTEQFPDNIKRTFAGIGLNGCLQMNDEYGSAGDEMTDTWTVFGDPSVMVRTATPANMTVSASALLLGSTSFTVSCNADGAFGALTSNGSIISTATAANGEIYFEFDAITQPGLIDLVVTAFNYAPHIGQVDVIAAEGPYLLYANHSINDSLGNDNGIVEFGETVFLSIGIENLGIDDGVDVETTISLVDDYMEILDDTEYYGTIAINSTVNKPNGFKIAIANNIPDQHELNFTIISTDINDSTWTNEFTVIVNAPVLTPRELIVDDSQTGNNNGRLDPGESAIIKMKTTNTGHCPAHNVVASLTAFNQYVTVLGDDVTLEVLGTFGASYPEFEVVVADDAPEGIFAEMRYELSSGEYFVEQPYFTKIGLVLEDWETGNLNKFDWITSGDEPWVIDGQYPYEGNFDIISGVIGDNKTSEFSIQYEVMADDSISFYKKVSSEVNFDKLKFFINNELQSEWSGTSEGWTRVAFAVGAGVKEFRWVYEKDYSGIGGADKAWVDYIELPTMMATTVYAGPNDESCENNIYECLGTATNYVSVLWETTGTGTFDDNTVLDANYTPSNEDIINKNVILSLTIIDVDGLSATDEMELTFVNSPDDLEMPEGPELVDLKTVTQSEYTTLASQNANTYLWSIYPIEAGIITGNEITGTVNWNIEFEGEAWVKVAGVNNCGIGEFSDSLLVVVSNTVGINDITNNEIDISPNPNNGIFAVSIPSHVNNTYNVSVINTHGKVVLQSKGIDFSNNAKVSFEISNASSGMYFVILENKDNRILEKVIIK